MPDNARPREPEPFETIQKLRAEILQAETIHELLREKASESALTWISNAEPEDRLRRAAIVYWEVPEARTADIAAIVFEGRGGTSGTNRLHKLMPSGPMIECSEGHTITLASRSMMVEIRGKRYRCPECSRISIHQKEIRSLAEQALFSRRVIELRRMPYGEYLATDEWRSTRRAALKRARYKCQLCDRQGPLNVHHRSYVRRGCEEPGDLIVLCEPCHAKFHDKLPKERP